MDEKWVGSLWEWDFRPVAPGVLDGDWEMRLVEMALVRAGDKNHEADAEDDGAPATKVDDEEHTELVTTKPVSISARL